MKEKKKTKKKYILHHTIDEFLFSSTQFKCFTTNLWTFPFLKRK